MKIRAMERIPAEVFFDPKVQIDLDRNIVTAADGRVWVDTVVGPPDKIERLERGETGVGLEIWGVRERH